MLQRCAVQCPVDSNKPFLFHCLSPYTPVPPIVQKFSLLYQFSSWLVHLAFDVIHLRVQQITKIISILMVGEKYVLNSESDALWCTTNASGTKTKMNAFIWDFILSASPENIPRHEWLKANNFLIPALTGHVSQSYSKIEC